MANETTEKNIYVMLTLTAIKDGHVWNRVTEEYPGQSEDSYTELEKRLSETLVQMGLDKIASKNSREVVNEATDSARQR